MPQDNKRNNTGRPAAGKTVYNTIAKSTRQLALEAMVSIMENGEYCDKVLHSILEKYPLEQRDRAFLMRLVEGTVERCIELDYVIDRYSKLPVAKQKPMVGRSCGWRYTRSCIWIRCRTVRRVTKRSSLPVPII